MRTIIAKYNNLPLALRATIWFTICNIVLKGISFFTMPLYTSILPTEQYGRMTVLMSYEAVLCIFSTLELYLGAYQRGILQFKEDVKSYENAVVLTSNIITVAVFLLVTLFSEAFVGFTGMPISLFAIMSLYFLGAAPYNCWLNKKRFDYDYKAAVIVTIAMALISNLLPIAALFIWGKTAYVKLASTFLISTVFFIPFWVRDFHPIDFVKNGNKSKEYVSFALKFQAPLVFHSLSYYVLSQSDRIMIEKFTDSTKAAFYSVAYSLSMVIMLVQNALNQVLKPWRFKKLEAKEYKSVRELSNSLVVMIGVAIICFMLVVPEVLRLMFSDEYQEAVLCIPPVTMSVFFLFLYTIFVDIESYYKKTKYIAYVSTFCAVLNLLLNYIGLQFMSYQICAYTTLISYIVMSYLHFVFMKRTCKKANVEELPVDSKFIWMFSAFLVLVFSCVNVVYTNVCIRYIILAVIAIILVINRKRIIKVIKQMKG
ncbi:MAG: oligosaccharide flippase family protein [Saccharofermentans sp.]|nr:oligosaccharide flippase family protein [Saccharofermentans sp.]